MYLEIHGTTELAAGDVTVSFENEGAIKHKLVILKTDVPADSLEVHDGKVHEHDYAEIGEIEGVAPGTSKSATFDLEPGTYALICNLPGHYQAGMYATLTVK